MGGYSFCDKTRFVQHTARHERLDTLMGGDFQQYRANVACGRSGCVYTASLGTVQNKASHFHCLKCEFVSPTPTRWWPTGGSTRRRIRSWRRDSRNSRRRRPAVSTTAPTRTNRPTTTASSAPTPSSDWPKCPLTNTAIWNDPVFPNLKKKKKIC